jgi:hypothetical protein
VWHKAYFLSAHFGKCLQSLRVLMHLVYIVCKYRNSVRCEGFAGNKCSKGCRLITKVARGTKCNLSKLHSWRNWEQFELGEGQLPLGPGLSSSLLSKNIKIEIR